jgi:hypothetical protein
MTLALTSQGQVPVTQISSDPFTNTASQHATEVEAATFSWKNTIVTAFQQGRFYNGGATWTHGSFPGLTKIGGEGHYDRATDTAVIYDAKHGLGLSLPPSRPCSRSNRCP